MMKIAFTELDSFMSDPEGWAERKVRATGNARMSYMHVTRMGAYRFHQTGDPASARASLLKYLDSYHLTNADRRAEAEGQLNSYMEWASATNPIVISHSTRVLVDLGSGLFSSGQIHRVDLDGESGGYRAVMLGSGITSLQDPRLPIIQLGYAAVSGRSTDLVIPAHQNMDGSALTLVPLSTARRESLMQRLTDSARIAAQTLSRLRS